MESDLITVVKNKEEQKQKIESAVQAFSYLYSVYLEETGLLKKDDSIDKLLNNIENQNGTIIKR